MKINTKIFTMLAIAAFSFGACSDDDDETCSADDDICTATITVCCTSETDCKYLVGDQEYATLEEASQSTECTASKAPDSQKAVLAGLQALTMQAKANL